MKVDRLKSNVFPEQYSTTWLKIIHDPLKRMDFLCVSLGVPAWLRKLHKARAKTLQSLTFRSRAYGCRSQLRAVRRQRPCGTLGVQAAAGLSWVAALAKPRNDGLMVVNH